MIADPSRIDEVLTRLARYHGHEQVSAWRALAAAGDFAGLAGGLITTHYDPKYARTPHGPAPRVFDLPDLGDEVLTRTAERMIAAAQG